MNPFFLSRGEAYSTSTAISATALATTRSYASLFLRARSSALTGCASKRSPSPSSAMNSLTAALFLPTESMSVPVMPVVTASGMPGNPAPVPISTNLADSTLTCSLMLGRSNSESTMCLMIASRGSVILVRFITLFLSTTRSICLSNILSCSSLNSIP